MKRRTLLGTLGTVAALGTSAGCYALAQDNESDPEGDSPSSDQPDQNGSQPDSNESGNTDPSESDPEQNESNESNESDESDTSPEKPDEENTTENDTDIREEQKARETEDVPEDDYSLKAVDNGRTDTEVTATAKVTNTSDQAITFIDVEAIFEDSRGAPLHRTLKTCRNISPGSTSEITVSAYHQQLPGEVANVSLQVVDSGRV